MKRSEVKKAALLSAEPPRETRGTLGRARRHELGQEFIGAWFGKEHAAVFRATVKPHYSEFGIVTDSEAIRRCVLETAKRIVQEQGAMRQLTLEAAPRARQEAFAFAARPEVPAMPDLTTRAKQLGVDECMERVRAMAREDGALDAMLANAVAPHMAVPRLECAAAVEDLALEVPREAREAPRMHAWVNRCMHAYDDAWSAAYREAWGVRPKPAVAWLGNLCPDDLMDACNWMRDKAAVARAILSDPHATPTTEKVLFDRALAGLLVEIPKERFGGKLGFDDMSMLTRAWDETIGVPIASAGIAPDPAPAVQNAPGEVLDQVDPAPELQAEVDAGVETDTAGVLAEREAEALERVRQMATFSAQTAAGQFNAAAPDEVINAAPPPWLAAKPGHLTVYNIAWKAAYSARWHEHNDHKVKMASATAGALASVKATAPGKVTGSAQIAEAIEARARVTAKALAEKFGDKILAPDGRLLPGPRKDVNSAFRAIEGLSALDQEGYDWAKSRFAHGVVACLAEVIARAAQTPAPVVPKKSMDLRWFCELADVFATARGANVARGMKNRAERSVIPTSDDFADFAVHIEQLGALGIFKKLSNKSRERIDADFYKAFRDGYEGAGSTSSASSSTPGEAPGSPPSTKPAKRIKKVRT